MKSDESKPIDTDYITILINLSRIISAFVVFVQIKHRWYSILNMLIIEDSFKTYISLNRHTKL